MYRKAAIAFFWLFPALLSVSTFAQSAGDDIDMKRIRQKSIRSLIARDHVKTASDFQHIETACYVPRDSSSYQTSLKTYVVKARIGKVWEKYVTITPRSAWTGRRVKFGFLFSKPENRFIYAENANEPIGEGNIIYVSLSLLEGIKSLGVAFEITRLDRVNKIIRFCYLKDGASNGSQEIHFTEMANGDTKISHISHYRSRSAFRDKELYPLFHDRFVEEFHENILRQIKTDL